MPIKLHRTEMFRDEADQGQFLRLDNESLATLKWLDHVVCDRNTGRSQPDSPFKEIEQWYSEDQYWSDAYNTRWNVAVSLYYIATHPCAYDFGRCLSNSLDYRDNWSEWSDIKRTAVADTTFVLWRWLLQQPPGEATNDGTLLNWSDTFAGRIFEFAHSMDLLDDRFFGELFQDVSCANRFYYDCLFVETYWERIREPDDP